MRRERSELTQIGVEEYLVLDDPTESCPFVLDYDGEQDRRGALRPIHRYSQDKRFELLLKKFLGGNCSRIKCDDLFLTVAMECNYEKDLVWNSVRKILKENGWSRYYDNIPSILEKIGNFWRARPRSGSSERENFTFVFDVRRSRTANK